MLQTSQKTTTAVQMKRLCIDNIWQMDDIRHQRHFCNISKLLNINDTSSRLILATENKNISYAMDQTDIFLE